MDDECVRGLRRRTARATLPAARAWSSKNPTCAQLVPVSAHTNRAALPADSNLTHQSECMPTFALQKFPLASGCGCVQLSVGGVGGQAADVVREWKKEAEIEL